MAASLREAIISGGRSSHVSTCPAGFLWLEWFSVFQGTTSPAEDAEADGPALFHPTQALICGDQMTFDAVGIITAGGSQGRTLLYKRKADLYINHGTHMHERWKKRNSNKKQTDFRNDSWYELLDSKNAYLFSHNKTPRPCQHLPSRPLTHQVSVSKAR